MSYVIAAAPDTGDTAYTIPEILQWLGGPTPPPNIAFPMLVGTATNLDTGEGESIDAEGPPVLRAIGLITCASVCYVNAANQQGYVYHANSGSVSQTAFEEAMTAIGAPPYANVVIAVAHEKASDSGYQKTVSNFISWGIPTANIVEITNLDMPMFGLNVKFQVGY